MDAEIRFRGVRRRRSGQYVAEIREPGKKRRVWLGGFSTAEEAARVYDKAAREYCGAKAITNFPETGSNNNTNNSSSPSERKAIVLNKTPMNTTSFMDKQIMDVSQGSSQQNENDHPQEEEHQVGHGILGGGGGGLTTSLIKDRNVADATTVSEIERTMKKHVDSLLHVLEGVSEKLTLLGSGTRHLENSMDDLRMSVGNNHGNTDGKMRQLENILRDVHTGVQDLKDKQAIVEAQLQLVKMQIANSKVDPELKSQNAMHADPGQTAGSASQQSHQQLPPPVNIPSSLPAVSPPNAPPRPIFQSVPPSVPFPNQFSQNQIPPAPQFDPYFLAPGHTQESPNQQYQLLPGQQPIPPPTVPQHHQFQPSTQPQYSQPTPQLPQQHSLRAPINHSQHQCTSGHHTEETPYVPNLHLAAPSLHQPPSQASSAFPPSQQYYGPGSNRFGPPSSKLSSGVSSGYVPPSGLGEPYHYGGPPSHDRGTAVKPQLPSATPHSGGSVYCQLPVARVLPHASLTSYGGGGGSGSAGTGNKVPN